MPLLIVDDLGMRKLPHTAAEDLLEVIMCRYERASTLLTSNRPVDDRGKLLGDTAAVTALLDRLLHHADVLKCRPAAGAPRCIPTCVRRDRRSRTQAVSTPGRWPVLTCPPRFGARRRGHGGHEQHRTASQGMPLEPSR